MIFDDHTNSISDQAERPDLRLGLSLFLIAIGCLFLMLNDHDHTVSAQQMVSDQSKGNITTSDLKDLIKEDPDTIKDLTQNEIVKLFGSPNFLRQESDILIWQYKASSCVLEIFWDMKGDNYAAIHTSYRPLDNDQSNSLAQCVRDLM
jgi:hypothetical protein